MAKDIIITPASGKIDFLDNSVSKASLTLDSNNDLQISNGTSPATFNTTTAGASVLKVTGTNGTLFEITDDLSSSLMSVNTIAGLPVLEVFSDYHIVAGRYNQNDFYLNTNGNLGLGTASPSYKLHVNGNVAFGGNYASGNDYNLLYTGANSSAQNHEHAFYFPANSTNDSVNWYLNRGNGAYGYWNIDFGGTSRFYIGGSSLANSGHSYINPYSNLGVGTTTPTRKLHVQGEVMINPGTGASTYNDLSIGGVNGWSNDEAHRINFVYGGTGNYIFQTIESYYNSNNVGVSKLRFRNLYNGSSNTDISMTILGNGNVGIGSDQPTQKLVVAGSTSVNENNTLITAQGDFTGTHGFGIGVRRDADTGTNALALGADSSNNGLIASNASQLKIGRTVSSSFYTSLVIDNNNDIIIHSDDVLPSADASTNLGSTAYRFLATYTAKLLAGDGSASAPSITFINDTNTGLYRPTNDYLGFATGGLSRMTIFSSGVQIDKDSPGMLYQPLENSSYGARFFLLFDYTNNASYPFLTNRTPSGKVVIKTGVAAGGGENTHFTIEGGNGTVDAYFEDVNLGIGTTSPGYKLDITHTSDSTTGVRITNSSTGTGARAALVLNSDAAGMQLYATGSSYNGVSGWADSGVISTDSSSSGGLKLNSQVGGISFQTSTSTKMIVLASGSVGIGTVSPSAQLAVKSGSNTDAEFFSESTGIAIQGYNRSTSSWGYVRLLGGGGEGLRVHTNNYVGIGTASPSEKLHLDSGSFRISGNGGIGADGGSTHIPVVGGGGYYTQSSSQTGYLKITLPVSWNESMVQFTVDVYEYINGAAKSFTFAGYLYSGGSYWYQTSAYMLTDSDTTEYTVRFGHDGTKCAVYIDDGGGASGSWSYPQVRVRDVMVGYSGYAVNNWVDGWSVGFTTSLGTISQTQTCGGGGAVNGAGAANKVAFWTDHNTLSNNTYFHYDTSTGSLGIGTASPSYRLDVHSASALPLRLVSSGYSGIEYHNTAGTWVGYIGTESGGGGNRYNSAASNHTFYNNSSAVLKINSSGSVGIGTISPSHKLEVLNTANSETFIRVNNQNSGTSAYTGLDLQSYGGGWQVKVPANTSYVNPLIFSFNNSERMRVESDGKIRITSNVPVWSGAYGGALVLKGDNATSNRYAQLAIVDSTGSIVNNGLKLSTNGDLGLNCTANNYSNKATMSMDAVWGGKIEHLVSGTVKSDWEWSTGGLTVFGTTVAESLQFKTNQSGRMTITSSGNVGINTTSPTEKLEVNGNIKHQGLTMTSGTDIDQLSEFSQTLTITTSWGDTGISSSNLATGTYIVQLFVNDYSVGGGQYSVYYSGTMSWYGSGTNDANFGSEIILHRAGHADNDKYLYLRTLTQTSSVLKLQIAGNYSASGSSTYTFKFRRMI